MIKIKICGLTRREDIEAVNNYLPDYIGFVFAKSKRQVSFKQAKELKKLLNPKIETVGVFVNESIETLMALGMEKVIDIIQLHGDEDEAYIKAVKRKVKLPVIKAIRIKDKIESIQSCGADFLLFDKYLEGMYGGGGESFDWSIINNIPVPYFLAGGIHLGNIEEALRKASYAIDVSSGVETNGMKDENKICEMIETVRRYTNELTK